MGSGCSSTMSTTQTHSKDQMQGGDGLRYSPAMGKGHDMSLTKAHGEDGQIGEYPGKRSTHGQSHMHYPANLTAMDDDTESCSLITLCDEDEVFSLSSPIHEGCCHSVYSTETEMLDMAVFLPKALNGWEVYVHHHGVGHVVSGQWDNNGVAVVKIQLQDGRGVVIPVANQKSMTDINQPLYNVSLLQKL